MSEGNGGVQGREAAALEVGRGRRVWILLAGPANRRDTGVPGEAPWPPNPVASWETPGCGFVCRWRLAAVSVSVRGMLSGLAQDGTRPCCLLEAHLAAVRCPPRTHAPRGHPVHGSPCSHPSRPGRPFLPHPHPHLVLGTALPEGSLTPGSHVSAGLPALVTAPLGEKSRFR